MKIRIQMKTPDALADSIEEAAHEWAAQIESLDDDERAELAESKREKWRDLAGKWFRHGEYITVEIDTDAQTCTVVPK